MEVIYPNVLNSLLTGLSTVDIPEESKPLFELKCDYFEQNSSTEMSVASAPYNWLSACDKVCESEYVYAQNPIRCFSFGQYRLVDIAWNGFEACTGEENYVESLRDCRQ